MCKKLDVHYFYDKYMHGLNAAIGGDNYDTGAGFFLFANKLPHRDIIYKDYICHYGNGSWTSDYFNKSHKLSEKDWLNINKRHWSREKNKKVIYTCITGGYDNIITPKFITEGFDYICFTDSKSLISDVWDIRPLPKGLEDLSQVKKQRFVKINPHLFLKEYDLSIWVDGNVTLKGDLNKFINDNITNDCSVYVPKHPQRDCTYAEANVVVKMHKDKTDITKPQMERYRKEGFPKKYGLLQSNIILRKHNEADCIKLMEEWFKEVKNGSHRDQLSFNYASWKNQDIKIKYLDKYIYKSEFFSWVGGHRGSNNDTAYDDNIESLEWDGLHHSVKSKKTIEQLKSEFYSMVNSNKKLETFNVPLY